MIDKDSFRALLLALDFTPTDPLTQRYRKEYPAVGAELVADFDTGKLIFPTAKGHEDNQRHHRQFRPGRKCRGV